MPFPAPEMYNDWRSWANAVLATLQDGTGVVAAATNVFAGGEAPTFYDTLGRVIMDPEGLWIYDAAGNPPIKPNYVQIDTSHLVNAAVTTSKLANLSVNTDKLVDLAVQAAKLGDSSVTSIKIANLAVGSAAIALLAVGTAHIADGAILRAKVQDGEIVNAKIADLAVNRAKVANAAIGSAEIEDGSVIRAKIGLAAIDNARIDLLAVNTANIADLAVTSAKMANLSVTSAKIQDGAITNLKISGVIQSDDYVPNVSGWMLSKGTGASEFNGPVISRDLILGSGSVSVGPHPATTGYELVETVTIDTGVATSAWVSSAGPLAATAGFGSVEVLSHTDGTAQTYWEAKVKRIYSRTRFTGTATLFLEVEIWAKWGGADGTADSAYTPGSPYQLTWTLYDVT